MSESKNIWNDPRVTAYALGELSGEEMSKFEQKLASDPELAAAVDETRSLTKQLELHYSHEPTPPLEASRRKEILADAGEKKLASADSGPWWKSRWLELAVAASILFVLVGMWLPANMAARRVGLNENELAYSIEDFIEPATATPAEVVEDEAESLRYQVAATTSAKDAEVALKELPAVEKKLDELQAMPAASSGSLRGGYAMPAESQPVAQDVEELAESIAEPTVADRAAAKSSADFRLSLSELSKTAAPATDAPYPKRQSRMDAMKMGMDGYAMGMDMGMGTEDKDANGAGGMMGGSMATDAFGMGMGGGAAEGETKPGGTADSFSRSPNMIGDMFGGGIEFSADSVVEFVPEQGALAHKESLLQSGRRLDRSSTIELSETQPAGPAPVNLGLPNLSLPASGSHPFGDAIDEGRGPGIPGDKFEPITDNAFQRVSEHPLSTFSVDVDTASYSKVRDFLNRANQLPRPDAVRIEELVNYFDYDYAPPAADSEHPFAARVEIVSCPWNDSHRLARIAIKGKTIAANERQACNLVFLIDTSGSMDAPNKLPLVQQGLQMLLSQLGEKDRVAIVVYAGSAGLVLDSTPASEGKQIRRALTQLAAGGSTNGGAGISLAYQTVHDNFIKDGVNRVILCTDGDFNVGNTGTDTLVRMVEKEAKGGVFLTVLGFGMGNHNDAMLEQVSGKGNGNYAFIDTANEAKKVLVDQTDATLVTIAKDVKLQVEFNPNHVSSYRLIGYENRVLAKEDFNDDKKDAGEIGAGHAVTALYELVPAGEEVDAIAPAVDALKYQKKLKLTEAASSDETLTLKLRYKAPDGDISSLIEFPVTDAQKSFTEADDDVRFAAAVAGFGMKLRRSEYAGSWTLADVQQVAEKSKGNDRFGLRAEFVELVRKAAVLSGQER